MSPTDGIGDLVYVVPAAPPDHAYSGVPVKISLAALRFCVNVPVGFPLVLLIRIDVADDQAYKSTCVGADVCNWYVTLLTTIL